MTLITSRCPVCGALKSTCAGHGVSVSPVDDPALQSRTETPMAQEAPKLDLYTFEQYGNEVTAQLTEEHAKKIGAKKADGDGSDAESSNEPTPTTKARKTLPENK